MQTKAMHCIKCGWAPVTHQIQFLRVISEDRDVVMYSTQMVTMVTVTKEGTIVFTEKFILDKTSVFKCLPESLGGRMYRAAGGVLMSRTGRHIWCAQEA